MVATGNNKLKRKNESNEVKIEPNMKALKKNDILIQYAALQSKYECVVEQNKEEKHTHVEAILLLKETVKLLEVRTAKVEPEKNSTEQSNSDKCEIPVDYNNLAEPMNKQNFKSHYCQQKARDKKRFNGIQKA